ncbi:hypothetical protein GGR50DRAFT_658704 [Xylaria sp. CBS 124048]|nr:hypothetical protein GGR50DRAFT_658704 [Xylaria sp. CBS 124048]
MFTPLFSICITDGHIHIYIGLPTTLADPSPIISSLKQYRKSCPWVPYTTPYTGTGAIKTEQGWVNSRDFGAPGTASGPGRRRATGPPVPAFHHAELTGTSIPPSPGYQHSYNANARKSNRSMSTSTHVSRSGPIMPLGDNVEVKGIMDPEGQSFDLPEHHKDLANMSNRDISLKLGLLHIKKGNLHENLLQAATNPEILSRDPQEQFKFRNENTRRLREIEMSIRAWEAVQTKRTESIPNPGLVDMLMVSQDYHDNEEGRDQPDAGTNDGSSAPRAGSSNEKKKGDRH